MKGLVIKELYCTRFQLILALLLALPMNLLLLLAGGGMMAEFLGTTMEIMAYVPYGITNFVTVSCFSSLILNTLKDDVSTGWATMQLTMPMSKSTIVSSKLLGCTVLVLILMLICYIQNVGALLLFGGSAEIMLMMPLVFGLMSLTSLYAAYPLALRFGTKLTDMLSALLIIAMTIVLTVVIFIIGDNGIPVYALRLVFYVAIPALTALSAFISHKTAQKLLVVNIEKE
ncbi:MAG: ABC-2 transporter permease [Oscillospiraceae bacterium]|nr:ABC-2 transporter permease [Oscillospiraceae bacterium]